MNFNMVIGQYYPENSVIHNLDARVKFFGAMLYIILVFMAESAVAYAFAGICLFMIIFVSKVPIKFILRGLKPVWFMLVFTMVMNIIFTVPTSESEYLINYKYLKISEYGIILSIKMAFRLFLLVTSSTLLTLTTTPLALSDAFEFFLRPLEKIKFPSSEVAMMMTIALRFIPTLMDEMDKIIKAQKARGADFETGSFMQRIKALVPILVPLFVSAFRRAEDLATAMEARCYRTHTKRTKMKEYKMLKTDYFALMYIFLFSGVIIGVKFLKIGI